MAGGHSKYEEAARQGAKAGLIIHNTSSRILPFQCGTKFMGIIQSIPGQKRQRTVSLRLTGMGKR